MFPTLFLPRVCVFTTKVQPEPVASNPEVRVMVVIVTNYTHLEFVGNALPVEDVVHPDLLIVT